MKPMPTPDDLIVHLDSPTDDAHEDRTVVQGWAASQVEIREIAIIQDQLCPLKLEPRPDVVAAFPSRRYVRGFCGIIEQSQFADSCVTLQIGTAGGVTHRLFPLPTGEADRKAIKAKKLGSIASHLQCPHCRAPIPAPLERGPFTCAACGRAYQSRDGAFDFLSEDVRSQFKIIDTPNISSNRYDPAALGVIGECHDGLVLDCGAGQRNLVFPNVINFEIVPYPNTDVLGVNERLPFRDGTFDAVLSLSVLEHVRDPFASASEICRVLKPGGQLYCSVPFLQPLHGYPHHYFNMTAQGLSRLFEEQVFIEKSGVIESGLPIWSLAWILRSWAAGLEGQTREDFLARRVGDLIGSPETYLSEKFVSELPPEKNRELASCTVLMGRKLPAISQVVAL